MNIREYISSGILEEYVLGLLSDEEENKISHLAEKHPEIRDEISEIEKSLEIYSGQFSVSPPKNLKTDILQAITREEENLIPPRLNANSKISDYTPWLEKTDPPAAYKNIHMEVIDDGKEAKMMIIWVKKGEPYHVHSKYSVRFLIIEGACTGTIGKKTAQYKAGDYVEFPVNIGHSYTVTSEFPMKVIGCLHYSNSGL